MMRFSSSVQFHFRGMSGSGGGGVANLSTSKRGARTHIGSLFAGSAIAAYKWWPEWIAATKDQQKTGVFAGFAACLMV